MLPGLFEPTIFAGRSLPLPAPKAHNFIRSMHPKTDIAPTRLAIEKVLKAGWWGQLKIHGHRAQIHVPSDPSVGLSAYNRQGRVHTKELAPHLAADIRRLFQPLKGVSVIDCEWLKSEERIYVFDVLRKDGELLSGSTYAERYELLPRVYASPYLETLGLLKTAQACLKALEDPRASVEGLVFKAPFMGGFTDAAIVRCRR